MGFPLQLVDSTKQFNEPGLMEFVDTNQLSLCGQSYVVVAIMGPQSSGKSTLLNLLFRTEFVVMDEREGRGQTTQGMWLAKAEGLTPYTLVLDLEGSDGMERGEDGTSFERQTALFALAVSDVLLINLWHHDIGRENAASRPLLRTVFAVMLRLLPPRRMTLMIVIRDVSPNEVLERLEAYLLNDLEELWNAVEMPADHVGARRLQDFFNVEVTVLANYPHRRDEFDEQVASLRNRFQNSIEVGGLASDRSGTVAGNAFVYSFKLLWETIMGNMDLDLPRHRVLVDTYRCDEIAREKLQGLNSNNSWLTLEQRAVNDVVAGFGRITCDLVMQCFDGYREDARYHNVDIMTRRLQSLSYEVWTVVRPSYEHQIKHHKDQAFSQFTRRFDHRSTTSSERVEDILPTLLQEVRDTFSRGCEDAKVADLACDRIREEVSRRSIEASEMMSEDIDTYVQGKREAKLSETKSSCESDLRASLQEPTRALLAEAGRSESTTSGITWAEIRGVLHEQVEFAQSKFEETFTFNSSEEELGMRRKSFEDYGREAVVMVVREVNRNIADLIMKRFTYTFTHDANNVPRQRTSSLYDVDARTHDAKVSSLGLLYTLAAIRLEEEDDGVDEDAWLSDLVPDPESSFRPIRQYFSGERSPSEEKRNDALVKLSRTASWCRVSIRDTLITPLEFKSLWESFETRTRSPIATAIEEIRTVNRRVLRAGLAGATVAVTGATVGVVGATGGAVGEAVAVVGEAVGAVGANVAVAAATRIALALVGRFIP